MDNFSECFDKIVKKRRAVRLFSTTEYNPQSVTISLKRALLAPTSSNMQLFELYRIFDHQTELKKQIAYACLNQNAAKTAREFIIVVTRADLYKQRAKSNYEKILKINATRTSLAGQSTLDYYKKLMPLLYFNDYFGIAGCIRKLFVTIIGLKKPVVRQVSKNDIRVVIHKSAALVAQTFMLSMSAENHDTCPMEGFDSKRIKQLLKLPRAAEINMIIACGKGLPEGIYNERIREAEELLIKSV
jgi:nitroreductase